MTKIAGSGSISQRHGSADPDPHQNVMDPQHCGGLTAFSPFCKFELEYRMALDIRGKINEDTLKKIQDP